MTFDAAAFGVMSLAFGYLGTSVLRLTAHVDRALEKQAAINAETGERLAALEGAAAVRRACPGAE